MKGSWLWLYVIFYPFTMVHSQNSKITRVTPPKPRDTNPDSHTVHHCVHATNKLRKAGDGSTTDSCFGCNPALPKCAVGCQRMVDRLYKVCDRVCLPDGYYYDSRERLKGCWVDVLPQIKVHVERCGCNAANSTLGGFLFVASFVAIVLTLLLAL